MYRQWVSLSSIPKVTRNGDPGQASENHSATVTDNNLELQRINGLLQRIATGIVMSTQL